MVEDVVLDGVQRRQSGRTEGGSRRKGPRERPGRGELFERYISRPSARLVPIGIAIGVIIALSVGWMQREEGHLTPESGTGYWLGIAGATAMLLLLVYPLRKRMPGLRFLGSVPFWFRTHMLLGILGPLLIVFHSNFKLGALNSNVAFSVMLIVAGSGVIGRYIYGKIHLGLSGRKSAVRQILEDAAEFQNALATGLPGGMAISKEMSAFAEKVMSPGRSVFGSLLAFLGLGVRSRVLQARLNRMARLAIAREADAGNSPRRQRRTREAEVNRLLGHYFSAIGRAAMFGFYERLFALWHVLHLPLFILLIAAAAVHVFAVHFY